jgi:hypothetical protein
MTYPPVPPPDDADPNRQQPPTYGYPPPPNYPYSYPQYAVAPPFNTYAILALVFAVAVFPPLGIYFGSKAKQQIARTGERGIELAQAGFVVGIIFSVFYAVFMVVWCGFAGTILSRSH